MKCIHLEAEKFTKFGKKIKTRYSKIKINLWQYENGVSHYLYKS